MHLTNSSQVCFCTSSKVKGLWEAERITNPWPNRQRLMRLETPFSGWSHWSLHYLVRNFISKMMLIVHPSMLSHCQMNLRQTSLVSNWLTACIFKSDKNHLFCKFDFYKQFLHGSSHIAVFFCLICIFWL